MKNLFKFGFLGLALTVGFTACNNSAEKTEETADTTLLIEENVELDTTAVVTDTTVTTDTIENVQ
ncbi:hypothetical protein M8998_14360 [Sphingobacterium sp. lm-10]|uniref:hypothetical protein n=1 Tax=Sphingobacterium sp. lm-10 TaxID=2944904 RepID=UPI00202209BA|nr:hypothetical protein [Sphingobacterium sp. lm-10]MCL7989128.1 hypothetical protein [Sphingobacterium sp. lm-10]